jgi:hypothetical protein
MNHNAPQELPYLKEVNTYLNYILLHPGREKAFPGYGLKNIIDSILRHLRRNGVLTFSDDNGQLLGLMFFDARKAEGIIEVNHILGNTEDIVFASVALWHREFPECIVSVRRRGKYRKYLPGRWFGKFQNN